MPKLVVNNTQIAEAFFEDAHLLGIQCPVETHRFVWLINRHLGYHFQYQSEGEIRMKAQRREYEYPVYHCAEANMELHHFLYVNNDDGKHLLPELKHIDFLWLLKGEMKEPGFLPALLSALRNMEQVQMVVELTGEKIKNKEHLVL